jgi:hypothetical protein
MDVLGFLNALPSPPPLKAREKKDNMDRLPTNYGTSSMSSDRDYLNSTKDMKYRGQWTGTRPFENAVELVSLFLILSS